MAPSGLFVSPHQGFIGRFEVEDLVPGSLQVNLVENFKKGVEKFPAPDVNC